MKPEEKELLELFCQRAAEIKASSVFQSNNLGLKFKVKSDVGTGTHITIDGPSDEELLRICGIVRQYISPGESIFFNKIYNIVYLYLNALSPIPEENINFLKTVMSSYKEINDKLPMMKVIYNEEVVTPFQVIDIWFNGHYFHADPEKAAFYKHLWNSQLGPYLEVNFRAIVLQLAVLMINFSNLIKAEVLE